MSLYVYGITRATSFEPGPIGFPEASGEAGFVRMVPCAPFAAIVGSSPRDDFRQVPKEEVVRLLLAHQHTLETIMRRCFVLPLKFGTTVEDEAELSDVLSDGKVFLADLISRFEGTIEIDVVASWDVPQILREIAAEDPEIASFKTKAAQGGGDLAFVGMLLGQALRRRADEWRTTVIEALRPFAEATADHDLLNDAMVLNSSFLLRKETEADFYHAVEAVDFSHGGKLSFRCVGPLPPYSFATLTIKHFDPVEIAGAARLLRLDDLTDLSQAKKRYRELSRQCHPDLQPGRSDLDFERLHHAYELILDYCRDRSRSGGATPPFTRLDMISDLGPGARRAA